MHELGRKPVQIIEFKVGETEWGHIERVTGVVPLREDKGFVVSTAQGPIEGNPLGFATRTFTLLGIRNDEDGSFSPNLDFNDEMPRWSNFLTSDVSEALSTHERIIFEIAEFLEQS